MRKREENDGWNTKNRAIWGMSVESIYGDANSLPVCEKE